MHFRLLPSLSLSALLGCSLLIPQGSLAVSTASDELDAALRATPDLSHGAALFETCAACHGIKGTGVTDGSVPSIAGQYPAVVLMQLVAFRHDQRIDIRMQHMVAGDHLTGPQQLADVAAYVASLPPPPPLVARASAAEIAAGSELYGRLCVACHRAAAEGSATERVPRLAGQHVEYLIRQLYDAKEGRRAAMDRDHTRTLARLDPTEIASLAAYLASLDPNAARTESAPR